MIFSTDNCPLCGDKLNLEIIEVTTGKVGFHYTCEKKELVRNEKNTAPMAQAHYKNDCYKGGSLCTMIVLPYILYHSESNKMTSVYLSRVREPGSSASSYKLIFRIPLLDMDYSQPYVVVNRLKTLALFS